METEKTTKVKLIIFGSAAKLILITCQFYRFKKWSVAFFLFVFPFYYFLHNLSSFHLKRCVKNCQHLNKLSAQQVSLWSSLMMSLCLAWANQSPQASWEGTRSSESCFFFFPSFFFKCTQGVIGLSCGDETNDVLRWGLLFLVWERSNELDEFIGKWESLIRGKEEEMKRENCTWWIKWFHLMKQPL